MHYSTRARFMLASGAALAAIVAAMPDEAFAQATAPAATSPSEEGREILVTGSRIKRDPNDSALPLQVVTTQEILRNGISSPEQLLSFLSTNGTGSDNLASNSDVVTGQQRGNNGASFANLRGQGSAATLILLNSRRVAAHGLNGSAVDVNQIPFAAIERVEVLKDGASAIYGTDAIGGVINFITKQDYKGFGASAFADVTSRGDSPIYRLSGIAGYGDLKEQGFNVMAAVGYSWVKPLFGSDRDFVNTFQPDRGLSVDTRGTPFATIVPLAGTIFTNTTDVDLPFVPGSTTVRATAINVLNTPGGLGCGVNDGQAPYDSVLWATPAFIYSCAWDTGRAAALQQELKTLTYLGRAVAGLGNHEISLEVTGSRADAHKVFSNLQLTPNTSTQRYQYRLVPGVNDATYNAVFDRLVALSPSLAPQRGQGFSFRWRCVECGPRQIDTHTETFRAALAAQGPLFSGWDYSTGASYAESTSQSTLGGGYFYRGTDATGAVVGPGIIPTLNSGTLNPFLFPGQTQSAAGLAALQAASAEGVVLYGGKYSVKAADASVSGSLFDLPGGTVKLAAGLDYRREEYGFNGDARAASARPVIIAAPFDDGNALTGVSRDIKAAYAEVLFPIFESLDVTLAGRIDDYSGFGTTTNPKVSVKFRPWKPLMFRASYNTAFRAPTFNQIFNGQTSSVYTGRDIADPATCPGGVPNPAMPGCQPIAPNIIFGGNPNLGPETADEGSVGVVFEPSSHFSASLDWWYINRQNTIQILTLRELINNYSLFTDRFIRDSANTLIAIDQTWANAGNTRTQGLEVTLRGNIDALGGQLSAGLDGTYLLKKEERVVAGAATINQLGVFTLSGDLGLRWKHNAFISYSADKWSTTLTQKFRSSYDNQILPGVLNGSVNPPNDEARVDSYVTYNFSVSYTGIEGVRLTAGVKNIFDTDPPFAVTYDSNTGSGSSWEPRVADPRGRAFTMLAEVRF
jgi:iron complex outermembrane receptor protein